MRKFTLLAGVALFPLGLAAPAWAQDHAGHDMSGAAPADKPAATKAQSMPIPAPPQPCAGAPADSSSVRSAPCVAEPAGPGVHMDMPGMDHAGMDHAAMNHSEIDHSAMDHSRMVMKDSAAGHAGHGAMPASGPVEGSGTSRLPQAEGMMTGIHFDIGDGWIGMAHGYAWGVYTDQTGARGDDGVYVQSMVMLMAQKPTDWGRVQLRSMMSAEPLMGARGYPNLFATGETANGLPLVDRQHPHDLFMELSARIDFNVSPGTTVFVYGGPVAEPALGPPAFMHRASARLNPEAPITHHWFDSTHITYGVLTAGVATKTWQFEASAFRGQEPDERRWDIETPRLDSWSVRGTLTPSPNWALQVSHGYLKEPEATHPGEDEYRTTASVNYADGRGLSATAAFSAKNRHPGDTLTAWLGEVNWDLGSHHTVFGRFENVANDELFPDHADPLHDRQFRVTKLQAGYAYRLPLGPFGVALGGSAAKFFAPSALDTAYGTDPMGYTLFAKLTLGH